jgi:thioredoxin reductase (NADPH)
MLEPVLIQGIQPGGPLTVTADVENYPGFEASIGRGAKLTSKFINVSAQSQIAGCRMAAFAPMFRQPGANRGRKCR